jgi:hypothetical protein
VSELELLLTRLEAWRKDPSLFVRTVLKAEPTEQQDKLLKAVALPGAKVSVKSGHNTGKTTTEAWLVLWHVTCFDDCKIPCTAPTAHQLKDVLWAEIAKWHKRMPEALKRCIKVTSEKVFIEGNEATQFAVARTARKESPESLQGFHATNLLYLIDEASGVPDVIFQTAEGALASRGARVVMCANPTQTTGYFYESHHRNKHMWTTLHFNCLESPLVDPQYPKQMAEKYGEDSDIYRVRVLGEFPNASINQLISRPLAELGGSRKLGLHQYNFAPKVLGVDVAWEGDDRSAVYVRQGLFAKKLGEWRNIDNMTLGGLIDQFWKDEGASACFIDVGWGTGVIDYLRRIGRDPIPVNFGGKSTSERFANKRTEMWVLLKEWLDDGGAFGPDRDLIEDIVGPEYFFQPNGKIMLEAKKDMKERGLSSPDLGDALALTFAAPVYKLSPIDEIAHEANKVETDYKLFG